MNLSLSSEQLQLQRASYEAFRRWPPSETAARPVPDDRNETSAGRRTGDAAGFHTLAAEGWVGLTLPEQHGGSGLDFLSQVLVLEAAGYYLNPDYWPFVMLGGLPLARHGLWSASLPGVVSGEDRVVLALYESAHTFAPTAPTARAVRTAAGYSLSGKKVLVPGGPAATALLFPARLENELAVFVVPTDVLDFRMMRNPDVVRPFYEVEVHQLSLPVTALLARGAAAEQFLADAVRVATVGLCAELLGAAEAVLHRTVEYVQERQQFGGPVGRFQAVKHRCADMKVLLESARSAVYYAAWAVEHDVPDASRAVSTAKAFCSKEIPQIVAHGLHLHGGMGFVWEVDIHLYYRRSLMAAAYLGDAHWHRRKLADLLLTSAKKGEMPLAVNLLPH